MSRRGIQREGVVVVVGENPPEGKGDVLAELSSVASVEQHRQLRALEPVDRATHRVVRSVRRVVVERHEETARHGARHEQYERGEAEQRTTTAHAPRLPAARPEKLLSRRHPSGASGPLRPGYS